MEAIVAVYSDWGIGSGGTQPVVLKADRAHFKELTDGAAVIVGGKRWAISPAAGRSRGGTTSSSPAGYRSCRRAGRAQHRGGADAAAEYERCLVIGGASVYRQFMPYLDTVHVTKIDLAPQSDSYFENLDSSPNWERIDEERWQSEGDIHYCFVTYKRRA